MMASAGNNCFHGMTRKANRQRRVLIIVENLPSPFDRRVWQEATTLSKEGYEVSIICPTGKGYEKKYEEIEGIDIYRHELPLEAEGALGYFWNIQRPCSGSLCWHGRSC